MNNHDSFSLSSRIKSFGHAFEGLKLTIRTQHNAWVHVVVAIIVFIIAIILDVSQVEWALLIAAIVAVWGAEAMNTAFELLCDVTNPEFHPIVKHAKDVAAGAVLICAIGSAIIGCIIFLPYFL